MTAASNEVVAVTQADRDMVQAFYRLRLNKLMEAIKDEKAGARLGEDEGDAGDLVQAFARHRIAHSDPRPVAEGLREGATDEQLKDAVTEMLSHRGERPYRILRGGYALWEAWLPAFRAALRYLPATHSPAPMAGEGWQDIASAPKDGTIIIAAYHYHPVRPAYWDGECWVTFGCITEGGEEPYHWMPFPTPPAAAHPSTQEG